MELCDLPCVTTSLDHIVVELIPESQSSQLWPREFSKGAEIQAVNRLKNAVCGEREKCEEKIVKGENIHVGHIRSILRAGYGALGGYEDMILFKHSIDTPSCDRPPPTSQKAVRIGRIQYL